MVGGNLQNVNSSTASRLPAFTIPYISCDDPGVMEAVAESFNSTDEGNVLAAVLYSQLSNHCNISNALADAGWLYLLTVSDMDQARRVASLGLNETSPGIVQIFPDLSTLPPGTNLRPQRKGSPIRKSDSLWRSASSLAYIFAAAMIILYALTSMITFLLLIVIIGGAIKARRHPERYGPRAILRPRQSRAKGIAMAMLETLPIVKFGDLDPKKLKPISGDVDLEMTTTTAEAATENQQPSPERHSNQAEFSTSTFAAGSLAANTSRPTTQPSTPDEATSSITTKSNTEPSPAGAETGARREDNDLPQYQHDSPSCSICTEDFALGEELRVLPCNHKFHPLCVDPWLLNVSGTCPLCRIDLRSPLESTNEDGRSLAPVTQLPASDMARRRSAIGGILRGTRGFDLQSIAEASREERIRFLRRWREDGEEGAGTARVNPNSRRRSLRLSQWLRDGLSARPLEEPRPAQLRGGASGNSERPHTWYAGEAGAADQAPRIPPSSRDEPTSNQSAGAWRRGSSGGSPEAADLSRRLSDPVNLDPNTRTAER
jgi:Ring finger domain